MCVSTPSKVSVCGWVCVVAGGVAVAAPREVHVPGQPAAGQIQELRAAHRRAHQALPVVPALVERDAATAHLAYFFLRVSVLLLAVVQPLPGVQPGGSTPVTIQGMSPVLQGEALRFIDFGGVVDDARLLARIYHEACCTPVAVA